MVQPSVSIPNITFKSQAPSFQLDREKITFLNVIKATRQLFFAALANLLYVSTFCSWTKCREFALEQRFSAVHLFYSRVKIERKRMTSIHDVADRFSSQSEREIKSAQRMESAPSVFPKSANPYTREEEKFEESQPQETLMQELPPGFVVNEENIKDYLAEGYNRAADEMDQEPSKSFNIRQFVTWPKDTGTRFASERIKENGEIGTFSIAQSKEDVMLSFHEEISLSAANTSAQIYVLISRPLDENPQSLIKNQIVESFEKFNPEELSDFDIYRALKDTLLSLRQNSRRNDFSADIAIELRGQVWVAHMGSGRAFLSSNGEALPLSFGDFSIIDYSLEDVGPYRKLFLISSDIRNVATPQQITGSEYKTNGYYGGLNNRYIVKRIACAAHAAGAPQAAALVARLPGNENLAMSDEIRSRKVTHASKFRDRPDNDE